jgi:2-oxoglutarate ferredoxin oxidoreductase subunit gamma
VKKRAPKKSPKPAIPGLEGGRYEIRFSGSGGQGIILAAVVLSEACGVLEGKYVCQSESYGPEARGGYSKADVVISDHPIDYPMAMGPDLLLAMNQKACDIYFTQLKPDGLLVVDATWVHEIPTARAVALPFTEMARKETGKEITANMVSLGAVAQLSGIVALRALRGALASRVPGEMVDMNTAALNAGIRAARSIDLESLPTTVVPEEEEV